MLRRHSIWTCGLLPAALALAGLGPSAASAQEGPEPRAHHQVVYDARQRTAVLLGGSTPHADGHRYMDDVWNWDGGRWNRAGRLPFPRSSHAAVYDDLTGTIVLFGGGSHGDFAEDSLVWSRQDTSWHTVGASPFGGLVEPGACFHRARSRVVLFGGWKPDGSLNGETWEWTSGQMTRAATTGPAARAGHVFAYDPARDNCLLFGGRTDRGLAADTWEWTETGWRRLPVDAPTARWVASAGTDPEHARVVLFGGFADDEVLLGDTWTWDGSRWRLLTGDGPTPRIGGQIAFDGETLILFGGRTRDPGGYRDLGDTWRLDGARWEMVR